jgi:exodeoxyribonuclease V gamma subunit
LGDDVTALAEREPFALNALERWHIGNQWLEQLAGGDAEHAAYEVERARGRLPLHVAGELLYEDLHEEVAEIRGLLAEYTQGEPLPPIELELEIDGVRLLGAIGDVWPNVHARAQFSRLGSRHELRHFIRYVALRALAERSPGLQLPEHSLLVARGGGLLAFRMPGSALELLRELIELYRSALHQPLPSFAGASHKYVERLLKGDTTDQALRAARGAWLGSSQRQEFGSDQDPYVRLLYPDFDAVLQERPGTFEQAALRLYKPLLESRAERK